MRDIHTPGVPPYGRVEGVGVLPTITTTFSLSKPAIPSPVCDDVGEASLYYHRRRNPKGLNCGQARWLWYTMCMGWLSH